MFFEKGKPTKDIWVYDYKTGIKHTFVHNPMKKEHLQEFVDLYKAKNRKETWSEENKGGRWRCFTKDEIYNRDELRLDFKWLDFSEEDDRSIGEIIKDMEDEASSIKEQVGKLKKLLSDII